MNIFYARWSVFFLAFCLFSHFEGSGIALANPIFTGQLTNDQLGRIENVLKQLTVEEKIGQLLMVGFKGQGEAQQRDLAKRLIQDFHAGSIILFSRNFPSPQSKDQTPKDVARLTDLLQNFAATQAATRIPLLIAVDQENGSVMQIKRGITVLPSAMALGATHKEEYAFQAGRITGEEMRAMGINMVLAPVADVHNNDDNDIIGTRSFGSDIQLVERMSLQFMHGLHEGGVLAVAKHFPGHGGTDEDPHETLPRVAYPREVILQKAQPFFTLAREGVDAIMSTHMEFQELNLGKDIPISLSQKGIWEYIRKSEKDAGYEGVIMPDDLSEMQAVRHSGRSYPEIARMAVEASSDMLIFAHINEVSAHNKDQFDVQKLKEVIQKLKVYYAGHPDQLDRSVRRILTLKLRAGCDLTNPLANQIGDYSEVIPNMDRPEHAVLAEKMSDAAVLIVSDHFRRFSSQEGPLSNIGYNDSIVVAAPVFAHNDLAPLVEQHFNNVTSFNLTYGDRNKNKPPITNQENQEISPEDFINSCKNAKLVIFGLINTEQGKILGTLVQRIYQNGIDVPIIAIAYHEPNLIDYHLIREISYLAVFSNSEEANKSLYKALRGEISPNSLKYLPVRIPQIFPDFNNGAPIVPREQDKVTVTATAGLGGRISPSGEKTFLRGEAATFTLNVDPSYRIDNVQGSCGGDRNGPIFTTAALQKDCTVEAHFISKGDTRSLVKKGEEDQDRLLAIAVILVVILVCVLAFIWFLKKFVFPEPDLKREVLIFVAMLVFIIVALLIFKQISPEQFQHAFDALIGLIRDLLP